MGGNGKIGDDFDPIMQSSSKVHYVGEFSHAMDAKRRLTVPARWRFPGDEAEVYLGLPNPRGFIVVYPPEKVLEINEKISQISMLDREGQAMLMYFSKRAHTFGCDRQGRIQLNEKLVAHAGIERETVLLGHFATFSIWSRERYEAQEDPETDDVSFEQTVGRFGL